MILRRKHRRGRQSLGAKDEDLEDKRPLGKIILRFRPMFQREVNSGETPWVTAFGRGEVRLRAMSSNPEHLAHAASQRHAFDRTIAPTCGQSEVYDAAAARLIEGTIFGGNGLLLIAGTPGSGRSHTLWGNPPSAPGLLPKSLDALARANSPFCSSPPFPSTFVLKLCVAEIYEGKARDLTEGFGIYQTSRERRVESSGVEGSDSFSTRASLAAMESLPRLAPLSSNGVDGGGTEDRRRSKGNESTALLASRALPGVEEVIVENASQAVEAVGHGMRLRRNGGHFVVAAKLIATDADAQSAREERGKATGELVFVELGDGPVGHLGATLHDVLAMLKIQTAGVVETGDTSSSGSWSKTGPSSDTPAASSARLAFGAECSVSPGASRKTWNVSGSPCRHGNSLRRSPLWSLIASLATDGRVERIEQTVSSPVVRTSSSACPDKKNWTVWANGGSPDPCRVALGAGNAVMAEGGRGPGVDDVERKARQLLVSVVATMRSGSGHYEEERALLEMLAKPKRESFTTTLSRGFNLKKMMSLRASMWKLHSSQAADGLQYENVPSAPAMSFEDSFASWSSTGSVSSPSEATAPPSVVDADLHSPTTPAKRSPPYPPSRPQAQRQESDRADGSGLEISDDPAEVCHGSESLRPMSGTAGGSCGDNGVEQSPEVALVWRAGGKLTGRKVRSLLSSRRARDVEGSQFVDMSREDLITRAMEAEKKSRFWESQCSSMVREMEALSTSPLSPGISSSQSSELSPTSFRSLNPKAHSPATQKIATPPSSRPGSEASLAARESSRAREDASPPWKTSALQRRLEARQVSVPLEGRIEKTLEGRGGSFESIFSKTEPSRHSYRSNRSWAKRIAGGGPRWTSTEVGTQSSGRFGAEPIGGSSVSRMDEPSGEL